MKLVEAEQAKIDLQRDVFQLKKDLFSQNKDISINIANKLETLLLEMIGEAGDAFKDFDNLCE